MSSKFEINLPSACGSDEVLGQQVNSGPYF